MLLAGHSLSGPVLSLLWSCSILFWVMFHSFSSHVPFLLSHVPPLVLSCSIRSLVPFHSSGHVSFLLWSCSIPPLVLFHSSSGPVPFLLWSCSIPPLVLFHSFSGHAPFLLWSCSIPSSDPLSTSAENMHS